jgi:hypothetical protein
MDAYTSRIYALLPRTPPRTHRVMASAQIAPSFVLQRSQPDAGRSSLSRASTVRATDTHIGAGCPPSAVTYPRYELRVQLTVHTSTHKTTKRSCFYSYPFLARMLAYPCPLVRVCVVKPRQSKPDCDTPYSDSDSAGDGQICPRITPSPSFSIP